MAEEKLIYIADDDSGIRGAIRIFLENEGYQVRDFPDGEAMLAQFRRQPCDLVILDVMMPGMDGFTICKLIREESTVPVIFLTVRDSDIDYATGMMLGGDDYFTKPFSAIALVMRVKAIFRRIAYESRKHERADRLCRAGALVLDAQNRSVCCRGEPLTLTPNEFDLLHYLMEHRDSAVSREQLLEKVWGYRTEVETRATDDTVRRLRRKLAGTDVVIEAVWGYGFRLTERKDA